MWFYRLIKEEEVLKKAKNKHVGDERAFLSSSLSPLPFVLFLSIKRRGVTMELTTKTTRNSMSLSAVCVCATFASMHVDRKYLFVCVCVSSLYKY